MSKHRGKRKKGIEPREQIMHQLNQLFVPGTKKSDADRYQIRSYKSLENYKAIANRFIDHCERNGIFSVQAMTNSISEYLLEKKAAGCSNATIKTYRTGLCRAFRVKHEDIQQEMDILSKGKLDFTLRREDLKRSRDFYAPNRVKDNEKGSLAYEIRIVCEATGLRRAELESVCPQHFLYDEKEQKHKIFLTASKQARETTGFKRVDCKGGRDRILEIVDDPEALAIINRWCKDKAPDQPILSDKKISRSQDIHAYRATYANRIYTRYAKPVSKIDEHERIPAQRKSKSSDGRVSPIIRLKGDLYGIALDRTACRIVSQNLGHNREEIFQTSYFRKAQVPKNMVTL